MDEKRTNKAMFGAITFVYSVAAGDSDSQKPGQPDSVHLWPVMSPKKRQLYRLTISLNVMNENESDP